MTTCRRIIAACCTCCSRSASAAVRSCCAFRNWRSCSRANGSPCRSTDCATSLAYFLNYEVLHLVYHLPTRYAVARWPLVGRLRRLHQDHHDPRLMARYNFNITYPIGDRLFGTLYRGQE